MSFRAKRELLAQIGPRYRQARSAQKSVILDEFVAATGYARKYAIRLLAVPVPTPVAPITRPRAPRYGPAVQEALRVAWAAANYLCGKRLVPFLPTLVASLERHGHLHLTDEVRTQLLAISPATADRLFARFRRADRPHGISTTKPGTLLKHQVPVRTFNDWNETRPGFVEADLVVHCGTSPAGSYLATLVLTDIATGWTECLALRQRTQEAVIQALDRARQLLPFPLLGLDTDNGKEFLNAALIAYCAREQITFTRGRPYESNDQCFVEQKNGSIVRQLVGYDRFEGEVAYRQLTELYRAVRLYVNFFQPSMKLQTKRRVGSQVHRTYDRAQTPFQRVCTADILVAETRERLLAIAAALDPVRLLRQLETLQDALWQHAVVGPPPAPMLAPDGPPNPTAVRFNVRACGLGPSTPEVEQAEQQAGDEAPLYSSEPGHRRKYRRTKQVQGPRYWRTRPDPFAAVWEEICQWLTATPERTTKSVFAEVQQRYPGQFPASQLRTLQRRVKAWRAQAILTFDDQWLQEEVLLALALPRPLQAVTSSPDLRVETGAEMVVG